MRFSGILLAAFSVLATGAWAQGIEYDDMYFNAEDRAKLKSQRELAYNDTRSTRSKQREILNEEYAINPTDSYSARNVNPEYTSRAQTQQAQVEESDYFVSNYQYKKNQFNAWNSNYNDWYARDWYRMNYWGPAINTWHSPYYGYNTWNSPWYDPYWGYNGWSTSFSFHYGHSWNYGWGGYYNPWNRPYYAWDPFYSSFGYGMGYGYSYWNPYRYGYYPGVIIINNPENSRRVVEGRRPTRSSVATTRQAERPRSDVFDRGNNSSRVNTSSRQAEYYNRSRSSSSSTFYDRQTTQQNRSRSWDNSSYDRNNSGGRTYSPSTQPSRSYSTPSTSSPSRSMGSGSSGRSRGRY